MSSFFTRPAGLKKRKLGPVTSKTFTSNKKRKEDLPRDDESISGSESDATSAREAPSTHSSDSEEEDQTEAERRLKLAEQYLENVRKDVATDQNLDPNAFDAEEIDQEIVARRLKEDVAEGKGRIYRRIAKEFRWNECENIKFGCDSLSCTGVATDGKGKYIYTISKDAVLCKWETIQLHGVTTTGNTRRRKPKQLIYKRGGDHKRAGDHHYKHHTAAILCVAASHDGRFVVTGGADRRLIIWNAEDLKPLRVYTHHRDAVTALAFNGKTNQLFSASKDRTVKIWSLNEMAYVETLFGHQDEVLSVSACGGQERCISVGGRDRTARLWKVIEESQLVFRGGGMPRIGKKEAKPKDNQKGFLPKSLISDLDWFGQDEDGNQSRPAQNVELEDNSAVIEGPRMPEHSLDCILQLDSQLFVTGADNGSLSLYSLHRKKPLYVVSLAHGYDPAVPASDSWAELDVTGRETNADPLPRYITALAGIPFSDLFVSGSWDGYVRVWRLSEDSKKIERVGVVGHESVRKRKILDDAEMDVDTVADENVDPTNLAQKSAVDGPIPGVINGITVFELGDKGKGPLGIIAAVGKEMRMARWLQRRAKNGSVYMEIPR